MPEDSPPKRKKTKRACNHCHKAHMTCDTSRPCQRCVQRGLGETCEDAPRKKKKYLAGVPPEIMLAASVAAGRRFESTPLQQIHTAPASFGPAQAASLAGPAEAMYNTTNTINHSMSTAGTNTSGSLGPLRGLAPPLLTSTDSITLVFGLPLSIRAKLLFPMAQQQQLQPLKSKKSTFLLSAADLEYSTLSLILQDNFLHNHLTSAEATPTSMLSPVVSPQLNPKTVMDFPYTQNTGNNLLLLLRPIPLVPRLDGGSTVKSESPSPGTSDLASLVSSSNPSKLATKPALSTTDQAKGASTARTRTLGGVDGSSSLNGNGTSDHTYVKCDVNINQYFLGPIDATRVQNFPDVMTAIQEMKKKGPELYHERNSKLKISFVVGEFGHQDGEKLEEFNNQKYLNLTYRQPEEIYEKVTKPFSYTPGYHQLIAYLRKRFPKEMLVKMTESMALYRPSFIACTNSLKEGDLIFMEQCFQRTLLTYDNFINVSGTPTIVWRRTGEIAYVGDEFCILTGWAREELLSKKKTFIVELLDDKLVLEYFQLFLRIAFGDFLGATMTECTLLTPKKDVKIRTGCMWTLKRDVFGIPMMIIGNFLPIIEE